MSTSFFKRPVRENKKHSHYLISIENIPERYIYFRIICQNQISKIKRNLISGKFYESSFLQEDYNNNPENFEITIIEKSTDRKELEALMKLYKEEFQYDLYPETLSYSPPNYLSRFEGEVLIGIDEFCHMGGVL